MRVLVIVNDLRLRSIQWSQTLIEAVNLSYEKGFCWSIKNGRGRSGGRLISVFATGSRSKFAEHVRTFQAPAELGKPSRHRVRFRQSFGPSGPLRPGPRTGRV